MDAGLISGRPGAIAHTYNNDQADGDAIGLILRIIVRQRHGYTALRTNNARRRPDMKLIVRRNTNEGNVNDCANDIGLQNLTAAISLQYSKCSVCNSP